MNDRLLIAGTMIRCPRLPHDWDWFTNCACVAFPAALLAGLWCGYVLSLAGGR